MRANSPDGRPAASASAAGVGAAASSAGGAGAAAPGGAERGQEIFYYKCWFCHNEYVKDIPQLKGLFQKANLVSGLPVNEANVKDRLRNGGPNMPSYKYVLNEADLDDLVSELKAVRRLHADR